MKLTWLGTGSAFTMKNKQTNALIEKDFPLRQHHPFKGWASRPGDSWSLSWIK